MPVRHNSVTSTRLLRSKPYQSLCIILRGTDYDGFNESTIKNARKALQKEQTRFKHARKRPAKDFEIDLREPARLMEEFQKAEDFELCIEHHKPERYVIDGRKIVESAFGKRANDVFLESLTEDTDNYSMSEERILDSTVYQRNTALRGLNNTTNSEPIYYSTAVEPTLHDFTPEPIISKKNWSTETAIQASDVSEMLNTSARLRSTRNVVSFDLTHQDSKFSPNINRESLLMETAIQGTSQDLIPSGLKLESSTVAVNVEDNFSTETTIQDPTYYSTACELIQMQSFEVVNISKENLSVETIIREPAHHITDVGHETEIPVFRPSLRYRSSAMESAIQQKNASETFGDNTALEPTVTVHDENQSVELETCDANALSMQSSNADPRFTQNLAVSTQTLRLSKSASIVDEESSSAKLATGDGDVSATNIDNTNSRLVENFPSAATFEALTSTPIDEEDLSVKSKVQSDSVSVMRSDDVSVLKSDSMNLRSTQNSNVLNETLQASSLAPINEINLFVRSTTRSGGIVGTQLDNPDLQSTKSFTASKTRLQTSGLSSVFRDRNSHVDLEVEESTNNYTASSSMIENFTFAPVDDEDEMFTEPIYDISVLDPFSLEEDPLEQLQIICNQAEVFPFDQLLDLDIRPTKLGEGSYGEVFQTRIDGVDVALKIVPFTVEQEIRQINGDFMKCALAILPEAVISQQLSSLSRNKVNYTHGFANVVKMCVIKGDYPKQLLKAWDDYKRKNKDAINDSPLEYSSDSQLYIAIALEIGGIDLEKYKVKNEDEALSLLIQTIMSLQVAEKELEFEHRDLHIGNVLVKHVEKDIIISYRISGQEYRVQSYGVVSTIIDFTNSRVKKDGTTIFLDLSTDHELFDGPTNEYQFEIYRQMKKVNNNEWSAFTPKTNCLWIHYLSTKIFVLRALRVKRRKELQKVFDMILECQTLQEFTELEEVQNLFKPYFLTNPS